MLFVSLFQIVSDWGSFTAEPSLRNFTAEFSLRSLYSLIFEFRLIPKMAAGAFGMIEIPVNFDCFSKEVPGRPQESPRDLQRSLGELPGTPPGIVLGRIWVDS